MLALLGLALLLVGLALVALAYLDVRPMKGWIVGAAQQQGVRLDFDRARVTLGGLRLRNLKVASPAHDAALAPQLFTIGAIDGSWSPFSRRLDALVIRELTITIVRDPDGTTSLDRWLAELPPPEPEPERPLSQLARALVPPGLEAHARIEGVKVIVIDRLSASAARTATLTGLTAAADLAGGELKVALGPGAVSLHVAGAGPARELALWLSGALRLAAGGHGSALLDARLDRQSISPALPAVTQLLSLAATFDFLPAERRTRVQVEKLQLLDGAAALTAKAILEDAASPLAAVRPLLEEGDLRLDLVALAKAVPPELGPLELEGEPLVASLRQAALAPGPQGTLTASGKLVRLRWRDVQVKNASLSATARPLQTENAGPRLDPLSAGLRAELRLPVEELALPGLTVRGVEATFSVERQPSSDGPVRLDAPLQRLWPLEVTTTVKVASVTAPARAVQEVSLTGKAQVSERRIDATAQLGVQRVSGAAALQGLTADLEAKLALGPPGAPPLAATGAVTMRGQLASFRDAAGKRAQDVAFAARAQLAGAAPAEASLTVDARRFAVAGLGQSLGPAFAGGPLHAEVLADELVLDPSDVTRSRGKARLAAKYGGATVSAEAAGSLAAVSWQATAAVPTLGPLAPQTQAARVSDVRLTSRGKAELAAGLRLEHDTQLDVAGVTTRTAAMRGVHVHAVTSGTTLQHGGEIRIALDSIQSAGHSLGKAELVLSPKVDLTKPSLELGLRGDEPATDLTFTAAVGSRAASYPVRWAARGTVGNLAPFAAFLPLGPDWKQLAVEVEGSGSATGVIAGMRGGMPVMARDPAATARGTQKLALTVRELHYRDVNLTSADIAAMTVKAEVSLGDDQAARRTAVVEVAVPALAAISRGVKLGAEALAMRLEASFAARRAPPGAVADPLAGELTAKLTVKADKARQTALPWYALAQPELVLSVAGDLTQKLAVALQLMNPGAGTKLALEGDLERNLEELRDPTTGVLGRTSLAMHGTLEQKLDSLDAAPATLKARGHLAMPFQIESGDLTLFRATAKLELRDVAVELPAKKLRVAQVRGELPVTQEIVLTAAGPVLVGQGERGLFSQLRFPDYRPFSSTADYLSIGELTYQGKSYGPVAGNARVDRDVIAIDQLELIALGGKITGQCLAELRGKDTQLTFRGKLTGIQPSVPALLNGEKPAPSGDKLDANTAVTIAPYRYGLEGRTEIVRIGRAHLLALLDLWDPFRADIAANRVRLALKVGYPEQVRLHFSRGFASLSIDLGGVAGLVRIDEIRGIPIGPALAHWLAPILEQP